MTEPDEFDRADSHGFFEDRSLNDPGWGELLKGIARFSKRHPLSCTCKKCRYLLDQQRKSDRKLLDFDLYEVVEVLRDLRHKPVFNAMYRRLKRHI